MSSRGLILLLGETRKALPGIAIALVVAVAADRLAPYIPGISALLLAILTGAVLRTFGWVPWWAEAGLKRSAKTLLRAGIVLLGLQLAIGDLLALGWETLVILLGTVASTFLGMLVLGRLLPVIRSVALMVTTGTAICGASAVAGAASVLDRGQGRDRDGEPVDAAAATSVAVVTLYGTVAMLLLPVASELLGLGEENAGVWIGASVHEVGQVVAAGGLVGAAALTVATMVKLGRVVLLAPLLVLISAGERRGTGPPGAPSGAAGRRGVLGDSEVRRTPLLPLFVVGFLAAMLLRSTVELPADFLTSAEAATTGLITMAMVGLGAGVNLRELFSKGVPALVLGGLGAIIAAVVALVGVLILL